MFSVYRASVTEASEDMGIVFCFVLFALLDFSGFVYAIASAAREFLYRKNNEYYEIKKKKKGRIGAMLRVPYFPRD